MSFNIEFHLLSKNKQKLVKFLYEQKTTPFTTLQIHVRLKIPEASISRWLRELEKTGFLKSRNEGKYKIYSKV